MSGVLKQINQAGSESILFAHRASQLLRKKQTDDALKLSRDGVKRFPFYAEGHYILARCLQALDNIEDARKEYQQVLTYMPGHIRALKALAYLYYKDNQNAKAHKLLLTFALYDPLNRELHNFLNGEIPRQENETKKTESQETITPSRVILKSDFDTVAEEEISENQESDFEEASILDLQGDKVSDNFERGGFAEEIDTEAEMNSELLNSEKIPETEAASREEFERNNIVDNIAEENKGNPAINLENFDNRQDDFSTIIDDLFQKPAEEETTGEESAEENSGEPAIENEPEITAKERPVLDSTLLFNDNRQKSEDEETGSFEDFSNLAKKLENFSEQISDKIEDHMVEAPVEEVPVIDEETAIQEDLIDSQDTTSNIKNEKAEQAFEVQEVSPAKLKEETGPAIKEEPQEPTVQEIKPDDEQVKIEDILANPSLLTTTFGEILIAQHKFDDARQVFLELSKREPQNMRFKKKIEFLDKIVAMNKGD